MRRKYEWMFCAIFLIACIAILFYGLFAFGGRRYYLISLAMIITAIIMFLVRFENRSPSVAEITLIAVMCALAIVARISFFALPNIKPMAAIVIITGISMGPEVGFLTGMISSFVSNFYFMQGSHTPFQMFAMGVVGFFAGVVFQKLPVNKVTIAIYGVFSVLILYGGIVDINTLYYSMGDNTWESIITTYGLSFGFNMIHAVSTSVFLIVFHKPILNKLTRVKIKYDLIR